MTADTFSSSLGVLFMGTGNDNNTWGNNANSAVFQVLEDAIANTLTSTVTGGTLDLSGSPPPAAASQVRFACLAFNGALTSNQTIIVPNLPKFWWLQNSTTGGFTLTVKTPTGTTVAVLPQDGDMRMAFCASNAIFLGQPQLTALVQPGFEQACAAIRLPAGGWLWEDGSVYDRVVQAPLFNAITVTVTGNTNGNTSITNLTEDMRPYGLDTAFVEGTGIAFGTTITFTGATTATLSQAATGSNAGLTLRILPWGQGDGSTTFNIPDRRYRVLVGRDNMNNNPANRWALYNGARLRTTGGEETHTLVVAEVPALTFSGTTATESAQHSHAYSWSGNTGGQSADHNHQYPAAVGGGVFLAAGGSLQLQLIGNNTTAGTSNDHTHSYSGASNTGTESATHTHAYSGTTSGGGGAHNNMQVFGITNWIIKS